MAGRGACRHRHDLRGPPRVRLGARHRPRERRPQRAAALQLGALPGGPRLHRQGVDEPGPVPLGGRALPLPLRQPVDAALPEARTRRSGSRASSPSQHVAVGRRAPLPVHHARQPARAARRQAFDYYRDQARASTATRPGPQHLGYLFKVHVDETEELAYEVGRKFIEGPATSSSTAATASPTRGPRTCRA